MSDRESTRRVRHLFHALCDCVCAGQRWAATCRCQTDPLWPPHPLAPSTDRSAGACVQVLVFPLIFPPSHLSPSLLSHAWPFTWRPCTSAVGAGPSRWRQCTRCRCGPRRSTRVPAVIQENGATARSAHPGLIRPSSARRLCCHLDGGRCPRCWSETNRSCPAGPRPPSRLGRRCGHHQCLRQRVQR